MVGYSICEVLNKSFYAIRDGKTPMYTSIFGVVVNIGCAALFVPALDMGINGLALASAVGSTAIAVSLLVMINKRRKGVVTAEFLINILKTLICGLAAFFVAKFVYMLVDGFMGGGMILTLVKLCIGALARMCSISGLGLDFAD